MQSAKRDEKQNKGEGVNELTGNYRSCDNAKP